ncbi:MAG: right-handed parallel beta-helix repeat-containing protein, partial [Verrucomicrobia bacterium]|nr:right-handed parallel beta-helix repeat-containing protein [Verrucomicrobiota bacterium]
MKSMFTASVTHSLSVLALVLALTPVTASAQGSLTPPGAPAPTMKTLTQVEPRTPIDRLPYTINQSGSYYLTSNLTADPGVNGISVEADHVTIDLGGFALLGGGGGAAAGIMVPNAQRDLNVRNGTIASWSGQGILASNAHNSQFEHLRIALNGSVGLQAGQACAIRDCVLEENQGDGVNAADKCLIKDCESGGNSLNGFHVQGNGTRITDCVAADNTLTGIVVTGAIGTITTCTSTSNGQDGIEVGGGCRVDQCTVIINQRHGIVTDAGCTVKNCTSNG